MLSSPAGDKDSRKKKKRVSKKKGSGNRSGNSIFKDLMPLEGRGREVVALMCEEMGKADRVHKNEKKPPLGKEGRGPARHSGV